MIFPIASPARHVEMSMVLQGGRRCGRRACRSVYECYQHNSGTPYIRPATPVCPASLFEMISAVSPFR